ncbi:MAG TPA: DUF3568 family protein [Gemmataceae bacterium]|jgi:hypothetical protein|nr:DUF3568 family protein [Gemmataceae bacterium]
MAKTGRLVKTKIGTVLLAGLLLVQAGCLAAAATCAAGGAAGYAYMNGKVTRDYTASRDDVWRALQDSLRELQMPIGRVETGDDEWVQESLTADGDKVHISLETEKSRIPAEGNLTHVGVRISTFGDSAVSNRILDQIGLHLVPASNLQSPPPPLVGQPQSGSTSGSPQSPPPPLAIDGGKK